MPASCLEVLKTAVIYGADAVYIGGELFGLRAKAKNFSKEDMQEGIRFAHEHGRKVYVTANITAHNRDLPGIEAYFEEMKAMKPDALIISDPGVFMTAKRVCPEIDRHISTQANSVNYEDYLFWHQMGAKRIVGARELSLKETAEIRAHIPDDCEMEAFVHGAMCISYSGRCLLSNYFTGRDANLGACTHPCRWRYSIVEETRPGQYLPVEENERGTYIFNSCDLCMIDHIPDLIGAGIDSFKIEGRMKTALYVAVTARAYRRALDDFRKDPALYEEKKASYLAEVKECTYRPFSTGFYYGRPDDSAQIYDNNTYISRYIYLGLVYGMTEDGFCRMEQRNKFSVGDEVTAILPDGRNLDLTVKAMHDAEGVPMESCPHPQQEFYVDLGCQLTPCTVLRKKAAEGEDADI